MMNKRRALEVLDQIPTIGEQVDALEMAIEALENSWKADAYDNFIAFFKNNNVDFIDYQIKTGNDRIIFKD